MKLTEKALILMLIVFGLFLLIFIGVKVLAIDKNIKPINAMLTSPEIDQVIINKY